MSLLRKLPAALFLVLFPAFAHAATVSCPSKVSNTLVEVGHLPNENDSLFPNASEEDIGGDYDDEARQIEWNFVNSSPSTTPAIAHCFPNEGSQDHVDIQIPITIKRCILRNSEFSCKSGTISCMGYVSHVFIEEKFYAPLSPSVLEPEISKTGKKIKFRWKDLTQKSKTAHLIAHCIDLRAPNTPPEILDIPKDMKECVFADSRFICTDTPQKHDQFWP